MNDKELFENNCLPLFWLEDEENFEQSQTTSDRKDLQTLLAELEDIKNRIENLSAKEWRLAKLLKFNNAGLIKE